MEKENNLEKGNKGIPAYENIDGVIFFTLLLEYKYFIIALTLLVTIIAGIYSFTLPNQYSSTVSVVPPKSSGSAFEGIISNLSSTLKDFGLTKLGGKTDGAYSFLVILNSRTVKDSIINKYDLAKRYEITSGRESDVRKEFESNLEVTTEKEGNYTVSITDKDPKIAASMANDYIAISNYLAQTLYNAESKINREYLEDRLKKTEIAMLTISDSLSKYSGSKMIFSPEDQAKSISSAITDLKAEILKQEIVYGLLKIKYGENDPYTLMQQDLINQLKTQINTAVTQPGFGGNFPLKNAAGIGIEFARLYAEFETYTKVKSFLLPMIEEARINENRQLQNLFVVDKALPPDRKSKPMRSIIIFGSFTGSFILSVLFVLLINGIKIFKKKYRKLTKKEE